MRSIRNYFIAGIIVLIPVVGSVHILVLLFNYIDGLVADYLALFNLRQTPGLGLFILLVMVFISGVLAKNLLGRKIIDYGDKILSKIPVLKNIYMAIKQVLDAFMSSGTAAFKQVALVEYPRKGSYVLGFITGENKGEIKARTKEDIVNIFIPTTPNPTSGMLIFVPKKDVIIMDMTPEEGLKLIVSGGVFAPPFNESKFIREGD